MWAAAEGNLDVVDALLKAGADFRTPLPSGFTPFFFAVREGRTGVVLRLLAGRSRRQRRHADRAQRRPGPSNDNPLLLAVENGHFELAAALLKAGADPNDRPAGYTALHAITWVRKPIRGDGNPPPIGSGNISSLDLVRQLVAAHGRRQRSASRREALGEAGSRPPARLRFCWRPGLRHPAGAAIARIGCRLRIGERRRLHAPVGRGRRRHRWTTAKRSAGTEDEALECVRLLWSWGPTSTRSTTMAKP